MKCLVSPGSLWANWKFNKLNWILESKWGYQNSWTSSEENFTTRMYAKDLELPLFASCEHSASSISCWVWPVPQHKTVKAQGLISHAAMLAG